MQIIEWKETILAICAGLCRNACLSTYVVKAYVTASCIPATCFDVPLDIKRANSGCNIPLRTFLDVFKCKI